MSVATRIRQAIKTVAASGTPVQLVDEANVRSPVTSVTVTALNTNEGTVVVGGKGVLATLGTHAAPTQNGIPLAKGQSTTLPVCDISAIWVDSTTSGDAVCWTALAA
jgi:hypothetical protein